MYPSPHLRLTWLQSLAAYHHSRSIAEEIEMPVRNIAETGSAVRTRMASLQRSGPESRSEPRTSSLLGALDVPLGPVHGGDL
jgi:hypothetical protein